MTTVLGVALDRRRTIALRFVALFSDGRKMGRVARLGWAVEPKIVPLGRKDSQVPDGFTNRRDEEDDS